MYLSKKFFLVSVVTHFVPHPPAAIEGSSDPTISVATSCLASIGHYTTTIIPQSLPGQYCNWKERYIKKKKITEFKKGGKCIFKNKTGTNNMVLCLSERQYSAFSLTVFRPLQKKQFKIVLESCYIT